MRVRVAAVLMRGGTSKGLFFHENHLPVEAAQRDRLILAAYGSPDPYLRQMDGIGGAVSVSSKVAIISPSADPAYDVEYLFGQVAIERPLIEYHGNCGNLSAAVGPFAIDEGLVKAREPITQVRILQRNTNKRIIAEVPVKDGAFDEDGDYRISGVPGGGSRIVLRFADPGGSMTGRLLPTGNPKDRLKIPQLGEVVVSIVDAANPVVFVQAAAVGLGGGEIEALDTPAMRSRLALIRCHAAVAIGLAASPEEAQARVQAVPKIAVVAPPQTYRATNGETVDAARIDLSVRMLSMGTLHRSYAVTGAICTAGAALLPGTVVSEVLAPGAEKKTLLTLGHPGGTMEVGAVLEAGEGGTVYREASVGRTARRLMEGFVLVPGGRFQAG